MKNDILKYIPAQFVYNNLAELREDASNASCKRVQLRNANASNTLILKFDGITDPAKKFRIPFLKDDIDRVKTVADYLIFKTENHHVYIYVVNMKSNKEKNNVDQIAATISLASFILDTIFRVENVKEITISLKAFCFFATDQKLYSKITKGNKPQPRLKVKPVKHWAGLKYADLKIHQREDDFILDLSIH